MSTKTLSTRSQTIVAGDRAAAAKAAAAALFVGLTLVFVTGFAHPDLLHDVAHDTRHALSFPCH